MHTVKKRGLPFVLPPPTRHLLPFLQNSSYIRAANHHTSLWRALKSGSPELLASFFFLLLRDGLSNAPRSPPPRSIINFTAVGSSRSSHSLLFLIAKRSFMPSAEAPGYPHLHQSPEILESVLVFKHYKREDSVFPVGFIPSLSTTASPWAQVLPCGRLGIKAKQLWKVTVSQRDRRKWIIPALKKSVSKNPSDAGSERSDEERGEKKPAKKSDNQ